MTDVFGILPNAMKRQHFYEKLSGKNFVWSVSAHLTLMLPWQPIYDRQVFFFQKMEIPLNKMKKNYFSYYNVCVSSSY